MFDRETEQFYWLDIEARDMAAVPKHSLLFMYVEIEDENDNPPVPVMPVWHVRVEEELPVASYIATVAATDLDDFMSPEMTSFHYRIQPMSLSAHYFQVQHG